MLMLPLTKLFNGKQAGEERQLCLDESGEVRPFSAWEEAFASSGVLLLGAVTDKRVEKLLTRRSKSPMELCCEDGTRLFLSPLMEQKLLRTGVHLAVQKKNTLVAVTANPFSDRGTPYDRESFFAHMTRALAPVPVVDAEKEYNAI